MNNSIFELLVQMMPVLAGVAVLLLVRSLSFKKHTSIIYVNDLDSDNIQSMPYEESNDERQRTQAFRHLAYRELIVNGIFEGNSAAVERRAFRDLSLLRYAALGRLLHTQNKLKSRKLRIAVNSGSEAERCINYACSYSSVGGIILSYMINYNISFEVV